MTFFDQVARPSRLVLGKKFFHIWFTYTREGCVLVLHLFFFAKCHLWNTLMIIFSKPCPSSLMTSPIWQMQSKFKSSLYKAFNNPRHKKLNPAFMIFMILGHNVGFWEAWIWSDFQRCSFASHSVLLLVSQTAKFGQVKERQGSSKMLPYFFSHQNFDLSGQWFSIFFPILFEIRQHCSGQLEWFHKSGNSG